MSMELMVVECGDCWERFLTKYNLNEDDPGVGWVVCPECGRVCNTEDDATEDEPNSDEILTFSPLLKKRPRQTVDANKKNILDQIGYTISPCCGLCTNGEFPSPGDMFGTCAVISYAHLKHTGEERHLSVNRYGGKGCEQYEADQAVLGRLGAFYEYYKEG